MKLANLRVEQKEYNPHAYSPVPEETLAEKAPSRESEIVYENPSNVIRWKFGSKMPPFRDPDVPSIELGTYIIYTDEIK